MTYRVRIDPVALRQIDQFAHYLRDYSEDFAIEHIERLDRILHFNLGESPLTWSYFPLTGAPYRAYLFRVGVFQPTPLAGLLLFSEPPPPKVERALGRPEVPQSCKDYDHAYQVRSQHIADIVAGHACASLGSRFFRSSLAVLFAHRMSHPLLTNRSTKTRTRSRSW
jgi:hypothetical protein